MASFQSMTAKVVTGAFIALIVVAFVFTFDTPQQFVGGGSLGSVGSYEIEFQEYNRQYNFLVQMYSSRMGGKGLTNQQIESFGLRQQALQRVIDRKLYMLLAEDVGIRPGAASIRDAIREQEEFKTDGQFDLFKYKSLLAANQLTPLEYERMEAENLMAQEAAQLASFVPVAEHFAQEVAILKRDQRKVSVIQVKNSQMESFVAVTDEEVDQYLTQEENKQKVNQLFIQRKGRLDQPEEVKARHILFTGDDSLAKAQKVQQQKIDAKNFASLAKKHSDGPTKSKGGDLGWFTRGKMVKEFDDVAFSLKEGEVSEPVKTSFGHHLILAEGRKEFVAAQFDDHVRGITRELVRKDKADEVNKLRAKVVQELLQKTSRKAWENIARKYSLQPQYEQSLSLLDARLGSVNLSITEREKIFAQKDKTAFAEGSRISSTVVFVWGREVPEKGNKGDKDKEDDFVQQEHDQQQRSLSFKLSQEWMDQLWESYAVTCRGQRLSSRQDIAKCPI